MFHQGKRVSTGLTLMRFERVARFANGTNLAIYTMHASKIDHRLEDGVER
jgi:hypothetical protein